MEGNFVKAYSKNTTGKVTFYLFEIAALVVCALFFVLAIVRATQYRDFWTFFEYFAQGVVYTLALYGLGRLIDLKLAKADCCEKKEERKTAVKKEDK